MRKQLILLAVAALTSLSAFSQTYGTPFFMEKFDTQEAFNKWTPENIGGSTGEKAAGWSYHSDSNFNLIEPASTGSAGYTAYKGNFDEQVLVSPMIDASGKGTPSVGLQARFIDLKDNDFGFWLGLFFEIQARAEGSGEWETVMDGGNLNSSIKATADDWYHFYAIMPDSYADKKFQIRIYYKVTGLYDRQESTDVYVDNVYVSANPEAEAEILDITPSGSTTIADAAVPVSVTVSNNGSKPLSGFDIWYKVNDGTPVTQTITEALDAGATNEYVFTQTADFSEPGVRYSIEAGVTAPGDSWTVNNSKTVTYDNTLTYVPYCPSFIDPIKGWFSKDNWTIIENSDIGWWSYNIDYTADNKPHAYWHAWLDRYYNQEYDLFSRRILFKSGEKVNLKFRVYTKNTGKEDENNPTPVPGKIKVFYAADIDTPASEWIELFYDDEVSTTPKDDSVTFTPPTGEGYIVFRAMSDKIAIGDDGDLRLCDIEFTVARDYDLSIDAITAPLPTAEVYSAEETMAVSITNNGLNEASGAKISYTIDDNEPVVENLPAIKSDETITYTFAQKANLLGPSHNISFAIIWDADEFAGNNTKSTTVTNTSWSDVEVKSIDAPRSGQLTNAEHVAVTLVNKGNVAISDIPLTLSITLQPDGTPVTITETVPGPIEPEATLQYTFTEASDFSAEGNYLTEVASTLTDDWNKTNDKVSTTVNCTYKTLDAGVEAIVGPADRVMTDAEYLIIRVKNYGEDTLYDVPVTATITYNGNEVATINGHVPSIPVGESVEYTFSTPVDMHMGGNYAVTASTKMENDDNADNDQAEDTLYAYIIDCGVEAIISPTATVVEGNVSITVLIKNYGDEELTDIPVYFKLGQNPQKAICNEVLAAGQSVEFTFPTTYNFKEGREYTLTIYTALSTDMNSDNDSCEMHISPTSGVDSVYASDVQVTTEAGTIVITSETGTGEARIYDMTGRQIAVAPIATGNARISVSPGIYMVRISTDADNIRKIIVR